MAAGWAGGTVIAGATGVEPAAIMMGLASAGCWWLAQDFNDLSDDPPQAYQEAERALELLRQEGEQEEMAAGE